MCPQTCLCDDPLGGLLKPVGCPRGCLLSREEKLVKSICKNHDLVTNGPDNSSTGVSEQFKAYVVSALNSVGHVLGDEWKAVLNDLQANGCNVGRTRINAKEDLVSV